MPLSRPLPQQQQQQQRSPSTSLDTLFNHIPPNHVTAGSSLQPPSVVLASAEIASLVENAVTSALATARKQWQEEVVLSAGTGTGTGVVGGDLADQLQLVVSRVDVLQEQLTALDAQALATAASSSSSQSDSQEELARLAQQMETRLAR